MAGASHPDADVWIHLGSPCSAKPGLVRHQTAKDCQSVRQRPLSRQVPLLACTRTGGAMDLTLTTPLNGIAVDVTSPYRQQDLSGFFFDAPLLSKAARMHRDLLATALIAQGLTNYPSEYWHWSYGDQGWAYRGEHTYAIYSAITPEGWSPAPEDVRDTPFARIYRVNTL